MFYFENFKSGIFYSLSVLDSIEAHYQMATVDIYVNKKCIYSETLSAGESGNIVIEDFYSLLLPYFSFTEYGTKPLDVEIDIDDQVAEFTVYYSDRNSKFELSSYLELESPFLSCVKSIFPSEIVSIPFFAEDDLQINFNIVTNFSSYKHIFGIQVRYEGFWNCSFSAESLKKDLNLPDEEFITSVSFADEYDHNYQFFINYNHTQIAGYFSFIDNLGFIRQLALPGTLIKKTTVENNIQQLNSSLINTNKWNKLSFDVKTAILDAEKEKDLRLLFMAPVAWFIVDNVAHKIVIESIADESFSSDDALYSAEFSFVLCDNNILYL